MNAKAPRTPREETPREGSGADDALDSVSEEFGVEVDQEAELHSGYS
jgi:hypothetical protein